jgi:hypothetical protein
VLLSGNTVSGLLGLLPSEEFKPASLELACSDGLVADALTAMSFEEQSIACHSFYFWSMQRFHEPKERRVILFDLQMFLLSKIPAGKGFGEGVKRFGTFGGL